MQALDMMDAIEHETSAKIVLAADPCYGACDLVHDKMQRMGVELVAHMGHSQMNIDSGMPTQFINVTYDGDPAIDPVLPILAEHHAIAVQRLANAQTEGDISSEDAQDRFLDAVGRVAPLTGTKLGLVGSIQHLHLIFDYKERLEAAGFEVEVPVGGARLTFPDKYWVAIIRATKTILDTISFLEVETSIQLDLSSIPASRLQCSTLTQEMLKRCPLRGLNGF